MTASASAPVPTTVDDARSDHVDRTAPERPASVRTGLRKRPGSVRARRSALAYVAAVVGSLAATAWSMQLWRADLRVPLQYSGDAISSAAHVKATVQWGWYENQPDLGAPAGQIYHDYPFGDNLALVFAKVAGWFTGSWPVVFNLYFLLGFPLAAVTGLWFLRRCGIARVPAVGLAVLWSVAPYHWMRAENHYYLSGYWAVPVGLWVALLVLRGRPIWRARTGSSASRGPKFVRAVTGPGAAVAVGLLVSATAVSYYAVFTALVIGFCGLAALVVHRSWVRLVGAAAAGAVLLAGVVLNMLPDVLYERSQGANTSGFSREPFDAEVYALKLTSLLMPAPGHRVGVLRQFRSWYDSNFPLASEQPALGLVAAGGLVAALIVCFLVLARSLSPVRAARVRRFSPAAAMLGAVAALTVVMLLMSTIGGFGTLLAMVSPSLRGWNRMSIMIGLTCLAVVGLVLQSAVRRVFGAGRAGRAVTAVLVVAMTVGGTYDQAIDRATPDYAGVAASYRSDQAFVEAVESTAGTDAMLFQLPFIPFPESPAVNGALDSDMVRLSLHSTTLRWNGGGIKGRPEADWPVVVAQLPAAQLTAATAEMGFTGIVVDRVGTDDNGAAWDAALAPLLGSATITSDNGRFAFYPLQAVARQVDGSTTEAERRQFTDAMLADPDAAVARIVG